MTSLQQKTRRALSNSELAARIVTAREALGLSAPQLAERIGTTRATIAAWEAGRSQPRTNRLVTLAGILSVSPSWLLSGLGTGPMAATPATRIEAMENGIAELRHLSSRIAAQVDDLEQRLAVLKKTA
jgi:transcriptional regulator with XRE-family HTH domain